MTTHLLFALLASTTPGTQHYNFTTTAEPKIELSNISGEVAVRGTSRSEVKVTATLTGKPGQWVVEATQEGDRVKVRACCGTCDSSRESLKCHNSGEVKLQVEVPERSALDVSAVSAKVRVAGVTGPQEVSAVSGDIDIQGSGAAIEVNNVSGDITLAPSALRSAEVNTVSGDVKINLPPKADARVKLSTLSGSLNGKRVGFGSQEKSYGKGTQAIDVSTVSGSVDVRERE